MAESYEQPTEQPAGRVNILLPQSAREGVDAHLVEEILRALHASPKTRAAIAAAGGSVATGEPRYIALSELEGRPPPPGVPLFNDAIGVLTVPAPAEGGVKAVETALAGVAEGIRVESEVPYRAI
jgi:hypothetical protein